MAILILDISVKTRFVHCWTVLSKNYIASEVDSSPSLIFKAAKVYTLKELMPENMFTLLLNRQRVLSLPPEMDNTAVTRELTQISNTTVTREYILQMKQKKAFIGSEVVIFSHSYAESE